MCEGSEHEVSWDDGRTIVEIGWGWDVSRGFRILLFLSTTHTLKNVVDQKWYGVASLLYIHPAFPTSATPLFDFVEAFHTSSLSRQNSARFQFCSITSRNSVTLKFGDNSIAIYSLKWSVTPTFLSRNIFYLQLSPYCPKENKKSMWEDLKISSFLSTRHRILPSCSCKVRDTMVAKCELVLQGTSAVD